MPKQDKIRQTKKALIEALQKSLGVVTQACKTVGIARATFYEYYNNDPEFKKACDDTGELAIDFVESKLFKQIESGDTTASIFYLKTKGKHRGYIQTSEHINHNLNKEITIDIDETDD
jgi:hypothetical protein